MTVLTLPLHHHHATLPPSLPIGGMDDVDNFSLRARGRTESEGEPTKEEVDSDGSPFLAVASTNSEEGDHDIL